MILINKQRVDIMSILWYNIIVSYYHFLLIIFNDDHIGSVAEQLKKDYNIEVLSPFQFYTKYTTNKL